MILHHFVWRSSKRLNHEQTCMSNILPILTTQHNNTTNNKCRQQIPTTLSKINHDLFIITERFVSKTCFLMWFHIRSVSCFGEKTQEHVKTIRKRCLEAKKILIFYKKEVFKKKRCVFPAVFPALFPLFKGPVWAHTGPSEPIWAHISDFWFNFVCFGSKTDFLM